MALSQAPNRLAIIRAARGVSGRELARRCGVDPSLVSRIEHGELAAWPKFRRLAAEALAVDEALIFGERITGSVA